MSTTGYIYRTFGLELKHFLRPRTDAIVLMESCIDQRSETGILEGVVKLAYSPASIGLKFPALKLGGLPRDIPPEVALLWILKIAVGLNFIFHGAWGVVGKEAWIPFFGFAGIGPESAVVLQRLVGVMDITLGLITMFAPTRWALIWIVVWAVWTASLRPLTGSAWWYFFERSGNYGPPLAFLIYAGWGQNIKGWLLPIKSFTMSVNKIEAIKWVLRISIGVQLITHGLYGVIEGKEVLIGHFGSVGLPGALMDPEAFLITIGWLEITMGALMLLKPFRAAVVLVILWEVFIGLLYPISGLPETEHAQIYQVFRTLERFGDYAGPLALLFLMSYKPKTATPEAAPLLARSFEKAAVIR